MECRSRGELDELTSTPNPLKEEQKLAINTIR
jgi:hypothetical protein